jgi:hypothetical protein
VVKILISLPCRYAHLINLDFFGDLLVALRELITAALEEEEESKTENISKRNATREALLCVITAFALLSGQGNLQLLHSLSRKPILKTNNLPQKAKE